MTQEGQGHTGQVSDGQPNASSESTVPARSAQESESTAPFQASSQPSDNVQGQSNESQNESQFIQVPKDQLEPFGGRYGDALKAAKSYQQLVNDGTVEFLRKVGVTGRELLQWLEENPDGDTSESQGNRNPDGDPSKTDPGDRPLTVKEFQKLQAQQEAERQQQEAMRRENETLQQGKAREQEFTVNVLKEAGVQVPDDPRGEWDIKAEAAAHQFYGLVNRAMRESIPPHYNEKAKQTLLSQPASPAVLAKAKEMFLSLQADSQNSAVADFAKKQSQTPGSTIGSGSGGKAPQKSIDQMSQAEIVNALVPEK